MVLYGIVWYCWPQLYNQRLHHLKPSFIQYVVAEKLKWSSYEDYVSLQKDKLQRKRKTSGSKTTLVPNWIYNTAVTRGDCKRMGKQGGCIIIVVELERGHWPPLFFNHYQVIVAISLFAMIWANQPGLTLREPFINRAGGSLVEEWIWSPESFLWKMSKINRRPVIRCHWSLCIICL